MFKEEIMDQDGTQAATFELKKGAVIVLPEGFKTEPSRNKDKNEEFSRTPLIMTAYQEKGGTTCHFSLGMDTLEHSKRIGVFIPGGMKSGDKLSIDWVEGNCACALPVM